jgi:hypothetical protein
MQQNLVPWPAAPRETRVGYHDRSHDPSLRPKGSRTIEALAMFYAVDRAQLDD